MLPSVTDSSLAVVKRTASSRMQKYFYRFSLTRSMKSWSGFTLILARTNRPLLQASMNSRERLESLNRPWESLSWESESCKTTRCANAPFFSLSVLDLDVADVCTDTSREVPSSHPSLVYLVEGLV